MKKYLTALYIMAISMAVVSCHKEQETIPVNSRGVPLAVADIIMGDSYKIDTLYDSPQSTVVSINNPTYTQHIIYCGNEILANSPVLDIDTVSPGVYDVKDIMREARVNFANQQSVERFKQMFPQYPEFSTVTVGDTSRVGQKAVFAYAVSVPTDKVSDTDRIMHWLESSLDDSLQYNSSIRAYGQQMERIFFGNWTKKESENTYINSRSLLVYEMTGAYVTYYDYFWGYLGGAHGMYCNRFISYSFSGNCPVTADYLFKPGTEDDVRELIFEAIAADEDFMSNHKLTSLSQTRTYILSYLNGEPLPIPDPGLISDGVVFSYQPYDIACYADGSFTLVIPYDKISKYFAVNPM